MSTPGNVSAEHVAARRVLLDALDVLRQHLDAVVLVGAQAVYLHAPLGDPRPTFTTDADLAIDPDLLATHPDIAGALIDGGFISGPSGNPGSWVSADGITIDLMVPERALPVSTRRTAPLPGHGGPTARRTRGLEPALFDNSVAVLTALEPGDSRFIRVRVAGPASLVVAKAIKIQERVAGRRADRVSSKDAGDLLRLLRNVPADTMGARLRVLVRDHTPAAPIVDTAIEWLDEQSTQRSSALVSLAVNDRTGIEPPAQITAAIRQLTSRLVNAYRTN